MYKEATVGVLRIGILICLSTGRTFCCVWSYNVLIIILID